jgi:hypothetical protein
MAGGFYNYSCQPSIKIQCQSCVNFWLEESKETALEDVKKYVKDFNDKSGRHIYLDVNKVNDQLMFSFSFGLHNLDYNNDE